MARAGRVLLWLLVALGAVGGTLAGVRSGGGPRARVPPADGSSAPVAGFAGFVVRRWLEFGPAVDGGARPFFTDVPDDGDGPPPAALPVGAVATVAVNEVHPGYWDATVAAEMGDARTVRFYDVGVAGAGGSLVAVSPPALVPAPPVGAARPWGPSLAPAAAGDPVTDTVTGFLAALLTGVGDVSRYAAPGVTLRAVTPPPFSTISVDALAVEHAGDRLARVRAVVRGTSTWGAETLAYAVTVVRVTGRWELTAVSGAPPISGAGR